MATKKMSKCLLCGSEYEVCKLCQDIIKQTPWRTLCDSPRHFQIYMIVRSIRDGSLTQEEAKEQLNHMQVTLDEVRTFVASVQATLLPLYEEKMTKPQSKKKRKYATDTKPAAQEVCDADVEAETEHTEHAKLDKENE